MKKLIILLLFPFCLHAQDSIVFNLGSSLVTIYKDGHQKRIPPLTTASNGKVLTSTGTGFTWQSPSGYNGDAATIIQDATHRFTTDAEKTTWNAKQNALTNGAVSNAMLANGAVANLSGTNTGDNATNSQYSGLASSKQNTITTGTTAQYLKGDLSLGTYSGYSINVQALTSSPADGQTIYFGTLPKAPVTAQGTSKIYIRQAGTVKRAEIYCFSGTAGTNESWTISIRLNNSGDTQIAAVAASTSERVFSNTNLSIAVVAGDYIEIKSVNPTWATNPLTTIFGGYIYIE
jgi:hypothetical protein